MPSRQLSPAARRLRKRGLLAWGIVLLVVWTAITIPVTLLYSGDPLDRLGMLIALQVFIGLLVLLGVVFVIVGVVGEVRSRRFNTRDWALADSLAGSLRELWQQPAAAAYAPSDDDAAVRDARLVEIERHFDSQTAGSVTGALSHRLQTFGSSFSSTYGSAHATHGGASFSSSTSGVFSGSIRGLSEVNLAISTTTRDNLMGDALFAVFEAPGPAGIGDTYRVISMSRSGVVSWIDDLVTFTASQIGGPWTHAGSTVLSWAGDLAAQYAPQDISYTTDRLKAIQSRPMAERPLVSVVGTPTGRNALIATSVTIHSSSPDAAPDTVLNLMPVRFPLLFGVAIARGVSASEQLIGGQVRRSLPPA